MIFGWLRRKRQWPIGIVDRIRLDQARREAPSLLAVPVEQWITSSDRWVNLDSEWAGHVDEVRQLKAVVCQHFGLDQNRLEISVVADADLEKPIDIHVLEDGGMVAVALHESIAEGLNRFLVATAIGAATLCAVDQCGKQPSPLQCECILVNAGLGMVLSDATLEGSQSSALGFSHWSLSRLGVMSPTEIGYIASFCVDKDEPVPSRILSAMRLDMRESFRRCRFQQRKPSRPELFEEMDRLPSAADKPTQLLTLLEHPDSAIRFLAAKSAVDRSIQRDERLQGSWDLACQSLLQDVDLQLVAVGSRLLGRIDANPIEKQRQLNRLLKHNDQSVFLSALASSLEHGMDVDRFFPRMTESIGTSVNGEFVILDWIAKQNLQHPSIHQAFVVALQDAVVANDEEYIAAIGRVIQCQEGGTEWLQNQKLAVDVQSKIESVWQRLQSETIAIETEQDSDIVKDSDETSESRSSEEPNPSTPYRTRGGKTAW